MNPILTKSNAYVFIAVRMKSSRLPLKAMLDIFGKPLLLRLIERIAESISLSKIVICTSTNSQDDEIEHFAIRHKFNYFRGAEMDVMGRFIDTAKKFDAETIVRVTGDNPLTDPAVLDKMIEFHLNRQAEYTFTNDLPVGTRAEIINVSALNRIYNQLSDPAYSEYMTTMLKRPDRLEVCEFHVHNKNLKRPELSVTVDTMADIDLVRDIYFYFDGCPPTLEEIIVWLDKNPSKRIIVNNNITLPEKVDCSFIND
jgi:spore coat polysaccharide biosynthesis protein SpsF